MLRNVAILLWRIIQSHRLFRCCLWIQLSNTCIVTSWLGNLRETVVLDVSQHKANNQPRSYGLSLIGVFDARVCTESDLDHRVPYRRTLSTRALSQKCNDRLP